MSDIPDETVSSFRVDKSTVSKDTIVFPRLADRLSQFPKYKFFTPALLYIHGRFTDAVLQQFRQEMNLDVSYMLHEFKHFIFTGFEDCHGHQGWNRTLWAVEASLWPAFEAFMLSTVISDPKAGLLYRTGVQDITIADPLFSERHPISADIPRTTIAVFGVDGSDVAVAVTPSPFESPWMLPRLSFHPPLDNTRRMAGELFGRDNLAAVVASPLRVITPTRPIEFRTQDIDNLPPAERMAYTKAVADYAAWRKQSG